MIMFVDSAMLVQRKGSATSNSYIRVEVKMLNRTDMHGT